MGIATGAGIELEHHLLLDRDNLSKVVRAKAGDPLIQDTRASIRSLHPYETAGLVSALLRNLAMPGCTNEAQDLRDGSLTLLEQVNLGRLPKPWLAHMYAKSVTLLGFDADPDGNVDAILRAGELIVPPLATQGDLGSRIFTAWNFITQEERSIDDRVKELAVYSGVNHRSGVPLTFEDAIRGMAGRQHMSLMRFSIKLGYTSAAIFHHIFNEPDRSIPVFEDFYKRFQRVKDIDSREIMGLLRCPELPAKWLPFIEGLESRVDTLPGVEEPTYGKTLKKIRESLGLSQNALGREMPLETSLIGKYEQGGRSPSPFISFYEKLLAVEGVTPVDILTLLQYPDAPWYGFIQELRASCGH